MLQNILIGAVIGLGATFAANLFSNKLKKVNNEHEKHLNQRSNNSSNNDCDQQCGTVEETRTNEVHVKKDETINTCPAPVVSGEQSES